MFPTRYDGGLVSSGRRKIRLEDSSCWVFNRMAEVYDARPAYPRELVDALVELVVPDRRVGDLGAGIGHLALPLAERGLDVVAVEPARAMLEKLRSAATKSRISLRSVHATGENTSLTGASLDLVVVADALHFLDPELSSREISRVLSPLGTLTIITCEFAPTPFMKEVSRLLAEATPRKCRKVEGTLVQLFAMVGVRPQSPQKFEDHTPVDRARLERIIRSISFFGAGMPEMRFSGLLERILSVSDHPCWSRAFCLYSGRRGGKG
jgi:ubiquinone/menaquinone biosynthesis C-methylase UbiE